MCREQKLLRMYMALEWNDYSRAPRTAAVVRAENRLLRSLPQGFAYRMILESGGRGSLVSDVNHLLLLVLSRVNSD